MNKELTTRASAALAPGAVAGRTAMVGLDAFVDEIVRVVDKRTSATEYTPLRTLGELGARISAAAGQSTNIELVVERIKLGGNGPIMANALAALGVGVTAVGPFGEPAIHPAFAEIAERSRVVSLGEPGHTDAVELDDGKLMIGKTTVLNDITWQRLNDRLGASELVRLFTESSLVALVNWTMIPAMSDIFEAALDLLEEQGKAASLFFFDLADPEKQPDSAVAKGCRIIAKFQKHAPTILGLNEKEAFRVAAVLGYAGGSATRADVAAAAVHVNQSLGIETVVVHPRAYALTASGGALTAGVDGPFCEKPLISTGAGDHFNAGFCAAKLAGLPDDLAVTAAVGTSGYYVRHAASPTLAQLAEFLAGQTSPPAPLPNAR